MYILRLSSIRKKYKLENGKDKVVLNKISLMFPERGLFSINGKSGSGKSTLLNIISMLDEPTSGTIYYRNKNILKWKDKERNLYRNKDIGIVFQSYHLLENETVIFNIMLPALISGKKLKEAEIAAKNLLKSINFKENLYHQKCKDLSGGEKERVAILRALINDPSIILADEPTGALDTKNSKIVMDLLKEISKTRLVILVSHNQELVREYSDTIIHLKEGLIDNIEEINEIEDVNENKNETKTTYKNGWIKHLSVSNFKRRLKRNIVSIISLIICLISSILIIGFDLGSGESIKKRSYHQLDYGVASIYKEINNNIPGSKMSLVQMIRPNIDELYTINNYLKDYYIEPNISTLVTNYPNIIIGEERIDNLGYYPVYSFIEESIDKSLLIKGQFPKEDNLNEVVINKAGYKYLKNKLNIEPLDINLYLSIKYEHHFYKDDPLNPVITDYFVYEKNIKIIGVVDDFSFLSTPKIYYSYLSMKDYLTDSILVNLSKEGNNTISWYERLLTCTNEESLSSYSYQLFLKRNDKRNEIERIINNIPSPYKIESVTYETYKALNDLIGAATLGMSLFLMIALLGTGLILGIISFSSFTEDKKISAILTCLGSNKNSIFKIYLMENLFIGGIASLTSIIIAPLFSLLANTIIKNITTFEGIIKIPYASFLGVPFLFPLMIFLSTFLVCLLATYIPLFFFKKISPKEELSEE